MKQKTIPVKPRDYEKIEVGDFAEFYPRFVASVQSGRARLFKERVSTVKVVKVVDEKAWVSVPGEQATIEIRKLQLIKLPYGGRGIA